MARQQLKNYVFTPGGAGVGTVKIPGNFDLSDLLTIVNATDQEFIYNFADPDLGATVSYSTTTDTDFPTSTDGVTTITLSKSTAAMSAADTLAIYVEAYAQYIRPWPFGTDAVERMRTADPQSLIDADFEYGLQNTKWQSLNLNNDVPSIYELPGSEFTLAVDSYVTFTGSGTISSAGDTSITLYNQSGTATPTWANNDYALVVAQDVTGAVAPTYVTANATSSNQRTLTVANTAGYSANNDVIIVQLPSTNNTTVATTAITSGTTTTVTVASGGSIATGTMIAVQTNTANVWELMMVTGGVSNNLTVVRRRLGTNSGNVNINVGNGVRIVSNVEIAQVFAVDSATSITLNRGWMNTTAVKDLIAGTVIQKLNYDVGTASGTNVEIIKTDVVGTAVGNTVTISRAQLGTTAVSAVREGNPVIKLSGIFQAGNGEINQIGLKINDHGLAANDFLSTTNHNNSNTEGLYQVLDVNDHHFTYYPRRNTSLQIGYTLNRVDTYVREAALFTGAAFPISSIVTDGASPSTITVTTPYAHGLSPGTPIITDITSGTGNVAYAEGSFTVLSIPSTTTFTYQGKSGKPVTGALTANVYIRPSSFFTHRPFDGGVLIGSGTPHRGAMAARQSKKYFRYQSGKGLVWTSGTLLSTNFDVVNITANNVGAGNTISITTEVEHYLQIGANVKISEVETTGYNGYYRVSGITSDTVFNVTATQTLGNVTAVLGRQPKVNLVNWHGGSVRAGIFDEQNGAFWENNGTKVNVVLRSATFQLAGFLSVEVGSSLVTGDGNCRFLEQLTQYDRVVIRGMSHTVTAILDNNQMVISPAWRGVSNQTRVKASRVIDRRVPQANFNIDTVDGNGPSGYVLDITKMQMLLIQYTWYGAGFCDFGLRGPQGEYIMCHRFMNNNVNDEAYMRSGNLPVRYSANNEGPTAKLAIAANASVTTITVNDASQFPVASVAYPFYVQIENEVVKVQGINNNTFTNCTRGATFTLWQDGSSKSFTMGTAASHSANVGVTLLDCTSSPTLNHWGSAVIMDGGFDQDRGYAFTFNRQNLALPTAEGEKSTIFLMRLAPSVSNTIIGDIGTRDLINRAQLILENMVVNITGGRYVIEGILNPTNVNSSTIEWSNLNSSLNGNQPSFTQFASSFQFNAGTTGGVSGAVAPATGGVNRSGLAPGLATNQRYINRVITGVTPGVTTSGSGTGANISIWKTSTTSSTVNNTTTSVFVHAIGSGFTAGDTITLVGNLWSTTSTTDSRNGSGVNGVNDVTLTLVTVSAGVTGGERLFALPINTTNSGLLDLSKVKQLGTSAIPGNKVYPDGPEVLAINITAATAGNAAVGEFQITFSETQA